MNEIKIPEKSRSFHFNRNDLLKILKGAVLAGIGAGATYAAQEVRGIDFGEWTPFVAMGCAVLANVARKWIVGGLK